jgi:hypothetical protein
MNYTPFNTKVLTLKNRFTPLMFLVHPTVTTLDVLLGLNKWACDNDLLLGWTVDDVYKLIALTVI